MSGWSLAVDFGTSNTAAAYRVGGARPQAVRLSEQADQMPSAVLAGESGVVVGGAAVRAARLDPSLFEGCPKRRLGEGEILLGDTEFAVVDLVAAAIVAVEEGTSVQEVEAAVLAKGVEELIFKP